jgi:cytochrome subunit of sulfide dehydrogenase
VYRSLQHQVVAPANAGTHPATVSRPHKWIPAVAGMTMFVAAAVVAPRPTPAAAAAPPPGASSCSGCHAVSASVETPVPRLVGRPAAEIIAAMQAFRAGARPATVMDRIARGFSDADIADIAAWYAAQKE